MKKKRILKKIGIGAAIFVAALVTTYFLWAAVENYSGAKKWKATQEKLVAANVELDFKKLIPETPPEDANFARTPLIAAVTDFEQKENPTSEIVYKNPELRERFQAIKLPSFEKGNPFPSWQSGSEADLIAIEKTLSAKSGAEVSVTEWMKKFEAEFAEIDAAAALPKAQLEIEIGETFLDHVNTALPFLTEFRNYQKVQTVRASAALAKGDSEQAKAALQTSFQLYRSSASHPTLIGYLVGQTSLDEALSIIWQGMKTEAWTAEELRWIQEELANVEPLEKLEQSLIFEMVTFQIGAGEFLKNISKEDSAEIVKLVGAMGEGSESSKMGLLALAVPTGVWDHNISFGCEAMLECCILPVRERRLPESGAIEDRLEKRNIHNFLAAMTLPAISKLAERGFHMSVGVDLAQVACATERYKLENSSYPDSLDQLMPDFVAAIPTDLMVEGKSLRYKKEAEGDRYRIYSVGKNKTDEGGRVEFEKNRKRRDLNQGDWAWGYQFNRPDKK